MNKVDPKNALHRPLSLSVREFFTFTSEGYKLFAKSG